MKDAINNIVVVGGGTAGWITAGLIASEHRCDSGQGVTVTLIESPYVKTIGVGEGTWPTMRSTLQKLGISEAEFLTQCSSSFKQGTKFSGWVTGDGGDDYYHPFSPPSGYNNINLAPYWQKQREKVSFVNAVSVQGHLCDRGLAPKQDSTPEFAAVANYGYHLDAGKFVELLQTHCTTKLGVRHVVDHVTDINGKPDTDIRSISTEGSGNILGDLFVDCTGFAALLLGKHYQIPFVDKKHILFNDTALAVQIPYSSDDSPIASQTISTATSAGWIWDIGLPSRRGIGHVYSSEHSNDQDAEQALRTYIEQSPDLSAGTFEPRKISFRPGHRKKFWHRNCVAVGMAAGFLEPLEASALVLIELAARTISEELPANRAVMEIVAKRYNEKFIYRWERIIDFLKLHYVLSKREDSDYWTDNRRNESVPTHLQELLALWRYHAPWHNDFAQVDEVFSSASYQYVLYGMGFSTRTRDNFGFARDSLKAQNLFEENIKKANQIVSNLPTNRDLLSRIGQHVMPAGKTG